MGHSNLYTLDCMGHSNLYTLDCMGHVSGTPAGRAASQSHRDLNRAPYNLYGVKCVDLVSLAPLFRPVQGRRGSFRGCPAQSAGVTIGGRECARHWTLEPFAAAGHDQRRCNVPGPGRPAWRCGAREC